MEQIAEAYLLQHGLQRVQRNYCCRLGEIDLIMLDGNTLVFIEVRYRSNPLYGSAAESITYHKQRKIIQTATHFLANNKHLRNANARFDVICLDKFSTDLEKKLRLDWIKSAFQVDSQF